MLEILSQECSKCDKLREPKLKLNQKKFNCFHCGYKENRDINASQNILKRVCEERCGTNLWGAVSMEAVKNHKFLTEKPPTSNP
ncbi:zinc ribbon domain-containing protein [endosymbiont GvMRE of Glomus versiforme]|uniref:zinc ribbon domain-containing protein n=1 Tax=endosymbiont GvMRE of Glomus versiforme TaxID=2039283 RepID=UPI001C0ED7DF